MIEPFKYLIQPVAVERDEDGKVVREVPGEVVSVYSVDQAVLAITQFENEIRRLMGTPSAEASENVLAGEIELG